MAIVINGSGTVTGISVGGLPDGIVDAGTLATNSVDSAELIDGAVDNSHLADDAVAVAELAATGTASSSTFLRGDNAWAAAGGGKVLQVVNYTLSDASAISSSSTSYIAASTVEVAITPAATSSKILISFITSSYKASGSIYTALYRDGSVVFTNGAHNSANGSLINFHYLHSPSTTSSTTYQIYYKASGSGSAYLKNNEGNVVSLTAIEIGA